MQFTLIPLTENLLKTLWRVSDTFKPYTNDEKKNVTICWAEKQRQFISKRRVLFPYFPRVESGESWFQCQGGSGLWSHVKSIFVDYSLQTDFVDKFCLSITQRLFSFD